jgi:hypothetical protein
VTLRIFQICCICGPYRGDYDNYSLLGCDAVWSARISPIFGDTYCLHLQGSRVNKVSMLAVCFLLTELLILLPWIWRQYIHANRWWISTSPHGVISQNTVGLLFQISCHFTFLQFEPQSIIPKILRCNYIPSLSTRNPHYSLQLWLLTTSFWVLISLF